ncbi:hypothetical protein PS870_06503 [Pseudomonas fluorescens]|uniref:Uncharacterized protein n=1 Tax=Pseudomonas fluorescens TaxID=294 RepID=A0A5E7QJQ8_PSEFL|nr:hypothetical protein PS870_06503 [Pseudomonas fluorescens]
MPAVPSRGIYRTTAAADSPSFVMNRFLPIRRTAWPIHTTLTAIDRTSWQNRQALPPISPRYRRHQKKTSDKGDTAEYQSQ